MKKRINTNEIVNNTINFKNLSKEDLIKICKYAEEADANFRYILKDIDKGIDLKLIRNEIANVYIHYMTTYDSDKMSKTLDEIVEDVFDDYKSNLHN